MCLLDDLRIIINEVIKYMELILNLNVEVASSEFSNSGKACQLPYIGDTVFQDLTPSVSKSVSSLLKLNSLNSSSS